MGKKRIAEGVLLLTVFVWGMNTPLMKMGLLYLSPMLYNALRLVLAAIFSWLVVFYSGTYKPVLRSDRKVIFAVSLLGFCASQVLLLIGLPHTTAGNASIMNALLPFTVVMMNRIFKGETISYSVILGIVVSLSGVICVVLGSGKNLSMDSSHITGAILILLSQLGTAYYTIFSGDLLKRYSANQIIAYVMTLSALVFSLLALPEAISISWQQVPLAAWTSVVFSGLFGLLFGNVAWIWVVGELGSTRASLFQNLVPVCAIFGAWVILGEVLEWLQFIGMVVVFVGLYVARTKGRDHVLGRIFKKWAWSKS